MVSVHPARLYARRWACSNEILCRGEACLAPTIVPAIDFTRNQNTIWNGKLITSVEKTPSKHFPNGYIMETHNSVMESLFVRRIRLLIYLLPLGIVLTFISTLLVFAQEPVEPVLPDAVVPAFSGESSILIAPMDATPLPPLTTENATTDNPAEENAAMDIVNGLRQRIGGLNCLPVNEILRTAAYDHSKDMHDNGFFAFTNPTTQSSTQTRAAQAGYTGVIGVSITAGAGGIRDSAEEAIAHIRSSRSNYFNLITAGYEEIGIGWFSGTQNFEDYWTVALGAQGGVSGVPCSGTPGPITHIPTVQAVTNRNFTLPTFNWTRNTSTTAGRTPATFFDVEVLDAGGNRVLRATSSTEGPVYDADNICTQTTCSVTPAANAYQNGQGLSYGQTYEVWVRAWSVEGGYVWSSTGESFILDPNATPDPTVTTTPDPSSTPTGPAPILNAPLGQVTSDYGNPQFVWTGVAGATGYEMYVAHGSNINQPVIFAMFDAARHCFGVACSVQDMALVNPNYRLLRDGTYVVYMRAYVGSAPSSSWSSEYTFTLNAAPPGLVTLTGIQSMTGTVASRPTYTWSLQGAALNAAYFYVYVAPQNNPSQWVVNQWVSRLDVCGTPDGVNCAFTPPNDWLSSTPHAIYVQSYGPGGFSTGGVSNSGFVGLEGLDINAAVPAVPTNFTVQPNQGRPTVTFTADRNASYYQVRLDGAGGQAVAFAWVQNTCGGLTCTLAPAIDVSSGTYQVYMQAWGPAGYNNGNPNSFGGPVSVDLTFGTPSNVSSLAAGNVNSGNPTLTWNGSAGATWYLVNFAQGSANVYTEWFLASDIGCQNGGVCSVTPPLLILSNNLSYTWQVYAAGPGGYSGAAQGPVVNVNAGAAPGQPQPLTPTNLTYTTTPHPKFEWRHEDNVSYYQFSINAGEPEFDPEILTPTVNMWLHAADLVCTDDNVCTIPMSPVYLGDGNYSWSVRGYSPAGIGAWSVPQNFAIRLP